MSAKQTKSNLLVYNNFIKILKMCSLHKYTCKILCYEIKVCHTQVSALVPHSIDVRDINHYTSWAADN